MSELSLRYGLRADGPADFAVLTGPQPTHTEVPFLIRPADNATALTAYRRLRRETFVIEQGLFNGSDRDDVDDDPPRRCSCRHQLGRRSDRWGASRPGDRRC